MCLRVFTCVCVCVCYIKGVSVILYLLICLQGVSIILVLLLLPVNFSKTSYQHLEFNQQIFYPLFLLLPLEPNSCPGTCRQFQRKTHVSSFDGEPTVRVTDKSEIKDYFAVKQKKIYKKIFSDSFKMVSREKKNKVVFSCKDKKKSEKYTINPFLTEFIFQITMPVLRG